MTTHKASLLLAAPFVVIFIATVAAVDIPNLPPDFKEFGALSDEITKSKIIDQINGPAGTLANAPKSADQAAGKQASVISSAPAPDAGKGKLTKIIEELGVGGPASQLEGQKTVDETMLGQVFKSASGPSGAEGAAADAFTSILKRGPPPAAGGSHKWAPPPASSASPVHVASSSVFCVGMVVGFVSFFVAS